MNEIDRNRRLEQLTQNQAELCDEYVALTDKGEDVKQWVQHQLVDHRAYEREAWGEVNRLTELCSRYEDQLCKIGEALGGDDPRCFDSRIRAIRQDAWEKGRQYTIKEAQEYLDANYADAILDLPAKFLSDDEGKQ